MSFRPNWPKSSYPSIYVKRSEHEENKMEPTNPNANTFGKLRMSK